MTASSQSTDPQAILHVITYLNWEREGTLTFENSRAKLLDVVDALLDIMKNTDPALPHIQHFLLGGQTILLNDIAQIRPNVVAQLAIYNTGGRIAIGPWYVQVDGLLANGESLIRDLLMGQVDAHDNGIRKLSVAYLPRMAQYTNQLPQILRGFGIDTVFLSFSHPNLSLPFRWESPDGSTILVNNYTPLENVDEAIAHQQQSQPDGPFLWMHPFDNPDAPLFDLSVSSQRHTQDSNLTSYAHALRENLPDALRPTLKGEAYLLDVEHQTGRFSARMHLKQFNAVLQAQLLHHVEPFVAIALTHGNMRFGDNARALLDYSWRTLLQNQTPEVLGGLGVDSIEENALSRYRRVTDVNDRLLGNALASLVGVPTQTVANHKTYITVWNGNGAPVQQVVALSLQLEDGWYPSTLHSLDDNNLVYSWRDENQSISFRAEVPSLGYRVYELELSREPVSEYHRVQRRRENAITDNSAMILEVDGNRLVWTNDGEQIDDVLNFYDGGDAGTTFAYQTPYEDVLVKATLAENVYTETSPISEQLIMTHRLRLAPALENGRRGRGVRPIDITTTATFYYGLSGVFFRSELVNSVFDHRLRAHINTGRTTNFMTVDAPFGLVERPIHDGVHAMQGVAVLNAPQGVLAVMSKGLPEYEMLKGDTLTIALTLLRSVGRHQYGFAVPEAQSQRAYQHEFALRGYNELSHAEIFHDVQAYHAPLFAQQHDDTPEEALMSYMMLEDSRLVVSALKPPQHGRGWVLRVFNPTQSTVTSAIIPHGVLQHAESWTLSEEKRNDLVIRDNHVVLTLEPYQIATVYLGF
jgi:alpha-mannosidase